MTIHDALLLYTGGSVATALRIVVKVDRGKILSVAPRTGSLLLRTAMTIGALIGIVTSVIINGVIWLPKALKSWVEVLRNPTASSMKEELFTVTMRFWFAQRALGGVAAAQTQFSSSDHAQQESDAACEEILAIMDDVMLDDGVVGTIFLGGKK